MVISMRIFWSSTAKVPFDIEFSPANNEPSRIKTFEIYFYSKEFIYVGIDAKVDPKNIRVSVRQRDDMNMLNDDFIALLSILSGMQIILF